MQEFFRRERGAPPSNVSRLFKSGMPPVTFVQAGKTKYAAHERLMNLFLKEQYNLHTYFLIDESDLYKHLRIFYSSSMLLRILYYIR